MQIEHGVRSSVEESSIGAVLPGAKNLFYRSFFFFAMKFLVVDEVHDRRTGGTCTVPSVTHLLKKVGVCRLAHNGPTD